MVAALPPTGVLKGKPAKILLLEKLRLVWPGHKVRICVLRVYRFMGDVGNRIERHCSFGRRLLRQRSRVRMQVGDYVYIIGDIINWHVEACHPEE